MTKTQLATVILLACGLLLLNVFVSASKPQVTNFLTPLELAGLQIYQREGCVYCHSQVVRPLRDEHARYGDYSLSYELAFFRDTSTNRIRIGPDLARVADKYTDQWLVKHLLAPRSQVPMSNMPAYPWLNKTLNVANVKSWMQQHPYPPAYIAHAMRDIYTQLENNPTGNEGLFTRYQTSTKTIHQRNFDLQAGAATELDALIAYLQSLE